MITSIKKLRAWWRERQELYRLTEALIGRKLPDFMPREMLLKTVELHLVWMREMMRAKDENPMAYQLMVTLEGADIGLLYHKAVQRLRDAGITSIRFAA